MQPRRFADRLLLAARPAGPARQPRRELESILESPHAQGAAGTEASLPVSSESLLVGLVLQPRVYDRIVRIVSLSFIAAVALAVTLGDLWATTRSAIYVVLGVMTIFLVLVQDVLPPQVLGRRRFAIEAVAGIGFVTVLAMLTGGSSSPFFFGYFLIVAGAALWITGTAPIVLALLTALVYLVGIAITPIVVGATGAGTLPMVGFNLLGLGLMAYLATVAGREQRRINDRALRLSRYDSLTELYYRAYFLELLDREIHRASRTGRPFCLLMLDLDGLKPINDTFGHPLGDAMLRAVADVIRREIRASDSAARYGGDEFIVLLPETDPKGAVVLAEKLRADIAHINIRLPDRSINTSVSVGLASYPADGDTSERLIRVVDQAMYEAKRLGKNRIAYPAHTDVVPRAEADAPTAATDVPGAEVATPRADPDAPTAAADAPTTAADAPRAESDAPRAITDGPHAAADAPRNDAGPGVPVMAPQAGPRPPAAPAPAAGPQRGGAPAGPTTARPDDRSVDEAARSRPGPQAGPRPPAERLSAARPSRAARLDTPDRGVEPPGPSVYTATDDPFDPWLRRAEQRGQASAPVATLMAPATAFAPTSRPSASPPRSVPSTGGPSAPGQPPLGQPPLGQPPLGQPPLGQRPPGQRPAGQRPIGQASVAQAAPEASPGRVPVERAATTASPAPAAAAPTTPPARPRAAVPLFGPAGTPGAPMPAVARALRTPFGLPPVMDRSTSPEEASWADLPEMDDPDAALR